MKFSCGQGIVLNSGDLDPKSSFAVDSLGCPDAQFLPVKWGNNSAFSLFFLRPKSSSVLGLQLPITP